MIAHALPVYRHKDYPGVSDADGRPVCVAQGVRPAGERHQPEAVFLETRDAAEFRLERVRAVRAAGFPVSEEDPRKVLEFAKEKREELV